MRLTSVRVPGADSAGQRSEPGRRASRMWRALQRADQPRKHSSLTREGVFGGCQGPELDRNSPQRGPKDRLALHGAFVTFVKLEPDRLSRFRGQPEAASVELPAWPQHDERLVAGLTHPS